MQIDFYKNYNIDLSTILCYSDVSHWTDNYIPPPASTSREFWYHGDINRQVMKKRQRRRLVALIIVL